jgi:hypothetical protein
VCFFIKIFSFFQNNYLRKTMEAIITFGKHKGTPITEVPVSYLTWMVASFSEPGNEKEWTIKWVAVASRELKRRARVKRRAIRDGRFLEKEEKPKARKPSPEAREDHRRKQTLVVMQECEEAAAKAKEEADPNEICPF